MRNDYDDPVAYVRRWDRLTRAKLLEASQADPLLFLADHIPVADRCTGALAIEVELANHTRTVILVSDSPADIDEHGCLDALSGAIAKICTDLCGLGPDEDLDVREIGHYIRALGFVHHRRGGHHVTDLDRWWAAALATASAAIGFEPLGVIARTQAGAIVRVPLPPEALKRAA